MRASLAAWRYPEPAWSDRAGGVHGLPIRRSASCSVSEGQTVPARSWTGSVLPLPSWEEGCSSSSPKSRGVPPTWAVRFDRCHSARSPDFSMLVVLKPYREVAQRVPTNSTASRLRLYIALFLSPNLPPEAQWGAPSRGPPPPAGRPPGRSAPFPRRGHNPPPGTSRSDTKVAF